MRKDSWVLLLGPVAGNSSAWLAEILFGAVVLHRLRLSNLVIYDLLLECIHELLLVLLFDLAALATFSLRAVDVVQIEILDELLHSFRYFFGVHTDEAVFKHLLPQVDEYLSLVEG